jgi:hypothetical protein
MSLSRVITCTRNRALAMGDAPIKHTGTWLVPNRIELGVFVNQHKH